MIATGYPGSVISIHVAVEPSATPGNIMELRIGKPRRRIGITETGARLELSADCAES